MGTMKNFINLVKSKNFLYTYQFKMVLSSQGFTSYNPNDGLLKDLDLYLTSTSIPGKKLTSIALSRYGIKFNLPGVVEYDPTFTTTVNVDADLKIHQALSQMQRVFSDLSKSGGGEKTIPNYQARLYILDKNMNESEKDRVMVLKGIYPSSVGPVEMKHDGAEIATCAVEWTMQYSYWENEGDPLS